MMPRSRDLVIFMLTMTHTQHQFLLHMCTQDEKDTNYYIYSLYDLGNNVHALKSSYQTLMSLKRSSYY